MSRWEPYGEHAWKARFDTAVDLVKRTETMLDLFRVANYENGRAKAAEAAKRQLSEWQDMGLCFTFLSDGVCIARWEFYFALWNYLDCMSDEIMELPDFTPVVEKWVEVIAAVQKEFHVKGLSSASSDTLQKLTSTAIGRQGEPK